MIQKIQNNFEYKISIKVETNSRGYNTTIHVYQGATKKEIDDTIAKDPVCSHRTPEETLVCKRYLTKSKMTENPILIY